MSETYPITGNPRGEINIPFYEVLMDSALNTTGAFIEIGVYKADTFKHIYRKAVEEFRKVVAVDSFKGMPKPVHTGDGWYHEGMFDTGGSEWFREKYPKAVCYEGFAPRILDLIPTDAAFAFIHLDIDHYQTTLDSLPWCWKHLSTRGILVCHDYYDDRSIQAAGAIKAWMKGTGIKPLCCVDSSIVFLKKWDD